MVPKAALVRLTPEDRSVLEARVRAPTSEQRDVRRARIVLLTDEGRSTRSIARLVDVMPRTVSLWRGRYPDQELHVVLDNLNTHKNNDHWLSAHPNVRFHFTPTSASWLNQVEIWFSILQAKSLKGASFTSVQKLKQHIDDFINAYNAKSKPFKWTKAKVHQRTVKGRRISSL